MEYFLLNKDLKLKLLLSRQSLNHFSNLIQYIFRLLRLELNQGCNLFSVMGKVAICCGSVASVLAGEMSHYEVLNIVHKGTSIIMADLSNTDRGFLHRVKGKIERPKRFNSSHYKINNVDSPMH